MSESQAVQKRVEAQEIRILGDVMFLIFSPLLVFLWPPYGIFIGGYSVASAVFLLLHDVIRYREQQRRRIVLQRWTKA